MGRRSIARERKPLNGRATRWLRGLIPLLQDKNLENLTLDEMAALSGKSKSTIYTYFSSKEEIYLTVTQMVLADLAGAIHPSAVKGEDMEEALREMLMNISKGIEGISIEYLGQLRQHYPEIWAAIEAFSSEVLAMLAQIYQKGMQQGSFKRFNIALLTALDSHFVMNIMTDASEFRKHGLNLKELVTEYLELRLSALKEGM